MASKIAHKYNPPKFSIKYPKKPQSRKVSTRNKENVLPIKKIMIVLKKLACIYLSIDIPSIGDSVDARVTLISALVTVAKIVYPATKKAKIV